MLKTLVDNLTLDSSRTLSEHDAKQVLRQYGIPVVDEHAAATADEAVRHADNLGYPVVVKALGGKLTHKSERKLVHLNLMDAVAVRRAADAISRTAGADAEGFLVQPQVAGRREWVAGLLRDPQFGPVVMFGLGGVLTEALSDVAFRLAPLTPVDVADMLREIKASALLGPFRGESPVNTAVLTQTLLGLSRLALEQPAVAEVDINPLVATPEGDLWAVDALMVLKKPRSESAAMRPPVPAQALRPFFYPRSIAFVGASGTLGKWGHMLLINTLNSGYQGEVFLVNRRGGIIAGRRVYSSLLEIEANIELAVVTVPAAGVPALIPQLKAKNVRSMLLITSGFAETDEKGAAREKELVQAARAAGISILGPNTMGICNPHRGLNCTSMPAGPRPGSTALVSQSGNMGTQFLAFAESQGIGIRGFCGTGNEAMATIEDFLEAFESDETTRTVMLYVESVKNGRRFFETARRLGKHKPVVLMKGGQSAAGQRAAESHTGAMRSDGRVFNAVCRQAGIVKVEQSMDLLDLAAGFASLPLPCGNRVAIMTLGGGWGVVTTDLCSTYGLAVPPLPEAIVQRIDKRLPAFWSRANPVDLVGELDPQLPVAVIEELLRWDACDAVINLGIMGRRHFGNLYFDAVRRCDPSFDKKSLTGFAEAMAAFETNYVNQLLQLMERYQKPVVGVSLLTDALDRTIYAGTGSDFKCVFYTTPERAVKTLSKMVEYRAFRDNRA